LLLSVTLRHLPGVTIPRTQVVDKVRFEEDPALARFRGRHLAGEHLLAKRLGVEFQEARGLLEVKGFHRRPPGVEQGDGGVLATSLSDGDECGVLEAFQRAGLGVAVDPERFENGVGQHDGAAAVQSRQKPEGVADMERFTGELRRPGEPQERHRSLEELFACPVAWGSHSAGRARAYATIGQSAKGREVLHY
jgi:hypothetical protein